MVFKYDPRTGVPLDVDVKASLRASARYQAIVATSRATADLLIAVLKREIDQKGC